MKPLPHFSAKMHILVCFGLAILVCLCLTNDHDLWGKSVPDAPGQVWQVESHRWTVDEEKRFSTWVKKTITENFFLRHGIPVDCADVPYATRWIYARIAHLPAAATTGDGHLIGHWSTTWRHLPTSREWFHDRRFRAALLYMLEETSTRTLQKDTYPIRIARDSVMPGTVFFGDGHAGIIGKIVLDGSMFSPVQTWEATLPRKVTKLHQRSFYSTWPDETAGAGLVQFRWPIYSGGRWRYLPDQKQPFYSLEQYAQDFCLTGELFDEAVARRIDPTQYDPEKRVPMIIDSIYHYLQVRVPLVQEGYRHCRRRTCAEGSYLWEVYSTPSRDDMIAFEITHLIKLIKDTGIDEAAVKKAMEGKIIHIRDGRTATLKYIVKNYLWLSHDPNDPIDARWGLHKCDMIRARMKNTLQDLDFVEQRYRSTTPKYADYERSLRLANLKDLQKEGKHAGCEVLPSIPLEKASSPLYEELQIRQAGR